MLNKEQNQDTGDSGIGIQAGGDVTIINAGLSYAEARQIALDVFRANFLDLVAEAKEIAEKRVNEITDKVLEKLRQNVNNQSENFRDPGFLSALFAVQKGYALTGDIGLGDLLVELLVDRSEQSQRSLHQIVLNEAIITAPKLTDNQLAILSLVFLARYAQDPLVINDQSLGVLFDREISPVLQKIKNNHRSYQHIEYTACGSLLFMPAKLEELIGNKYQGLFMKGFDRNEIEARDINLGADLNIFVTCINDNTKLQVNAMNKAVIEQMQIPANDRTKIFELFDYGKMSEKQIREKCIIIRPYMKEMFDHWSSSSMKSLQLTTVGIAIGHANVRRLIGEFPNLEFWIK